MNKKDLQPPAKSSKFIADLFADINANHAECRDAKSFIRKHTLVEYCFSEECPMNCVTLPLNPKQAELHARREQLLRKQVSPSMLPTAAYYGTVYAIKNNSIVEFYNYFANEQIFSERTGYISEECTQFYRGVCTIHNMNISDIESFSNKTAFEDMDELISHDLDRTINFLIALLLNGFVLYVQKN